MHSLVTLNNGLLAPLVSDRALGFIATHEYDVVRSHDSTREWNVRSLAYVYIIRDAANIDLIAYHWHPQGNSRVSWPHLHVYWPLLKPGSMLLRAHMPTSHVALEDVIRFAIEELGVTPRRSNWSNILAETRVLFAQERL